MVLVTQEAEAERVNIQDEFGLQSEDKGNSVSLQNKYRASSVAEHLSRAFGFHI